MQCPKCGALAPKGISFCPHDGTPIPAPEVMLRPGIKIGEYLVESKLGAGGMGEVWRASHPIIGKKVAIKVLDEDLTTSPQAIVRFIQEARSVNQIGHRNIIDIFAFGELADGRPYFIMEYLEGKPLSLYLKEKRALPFAEILSLAEQLCEGLSAAHQQNIIHRDIKPDNIFLCFEPRRIFVKILDFGIAKLAQGGGSWGQGLTRTGAVFGTPHYMSPEQCEGKRDVDHRADLYALGVILFEMITGKTPFGDDDTPGAVIMAQHILTAAPKPSQVLPARRLPESIDQLFARLLAKKPEERPQSTEELLHLLETAIGEQASEKSLPFQESQHRRAESPTISIEGLAAKLTQSEAPTQAPPQITVSKRKCVLLVDDEPTQLFFQRLLLASDNLRVLEAKSGAEALVIATQQQPSLIVVDFMMPSMDGLETVAKLRALPSLSQTPILLTVEPVELSYAQQRAAELRLELITKPLDQTEFFQRVQRLAACPSA